VAGNVLELVAVSAWYSACLQILNSLNISVMDEATLFKFDKWVDSSMGALGGSLRG